MYWNLDNLHGWTMPQKYPMDDFQLRKYLLRFNRKFTQKYHTHRSFEAGAKSWANRRNVSRGNRRYQHTNQNRV